MNETTTRTLLLRDLIADLRADADAAFSARETGRPRGPVSGMPALDELIGGALAPGIHVLQGAPGCGKSALALQIAACCQFPCLFVSAEMGPLELFRRLISRHTDIFLNRLKTGELEPAAVERLAIDTARACADLAIFDATRGGGDLLAIEAAVAALTGRSGQCLVVIDSLHQWAAGLTAATGATEYDGLGAALSALTAIATSTGSPVLTIAHRNRQGQRGGGGLHAAKGHGGIEYAAESVIDLNLDESQKFEVIAGADRLVNLTLEKNRHGAAGASLTLRFSPRLQRFEVATGNERPGRSRRAAVTSTAAAIEWDNDND